MSKILWTSTIGYFHFSHDFALFPRKRDSASSRTTGSLSRRRLSALLQQFGSSFNKRTVLGRILTLLLSTTARPAGVVDALIPSCLLTASPLVSRVHFYFF